MKHISILCVLILILQSCSNDDEINDTREFVKGEVVVGFNSGTDMEALFDFINENGHEIDNINSMVFTTDLPSNNLQDVLDNLNERVYIGTTNWPITGYLHYQTNVITIFPRLYDMHRKENQMDWLDAMEQYRLTEQHYSESASGVILFYVPVGKEREWKRRFENQRIVKWAELNYIGGFETNDN